MSATFSVPDCTFEGIKLPAPPNPTHGLAAPPFNLVHYPYSETTCTVRFPAAGENAALLKSDHCSGNTSPIREHSIRARRSVVHALPPPPPPHQDKVEPLVLWLCSLSCFSHPGACFRLRSSSLALLSYCGASLPSWFRETNKGIRLCWHEFLHF